MFHVSSDIVRFRDLCVGAEFKQFRGRKVKISDHKARDLDYGYESFVDLNEIVSSSSRIVERAS